jgi:hypothetical protein
LILPPHPPHFTGTHTLLVGTHFKLMRLDNKGEGRSEYEMKSSALSLSLSQLGMSAQA